MRSCPNCKTEIEDRYLHCWTCGSKLTATQPVTNKAVAPQFASVETKADLPDNQWVQDNQTRMRTCPNCKTEIEDKYSHCWNCGSKFTATQPMIEKRLAAAPQFPSVKENQTRATTCPNCKREIEDKYSHCWNCGSKLVATQPVTKKPVAPQFTSVETDANLPKGIWWWFRLLPVRIVLGLVMLGILKILGSTFLGTYGLYIFIGAAVVAMLIILWRSFHRDPIEGVGIELLHHTRRDGETE